MTVKTNHAIALVLVFLWLLIGSVKWWEITVPIRNNQWIGVVLTSQSNHWVKPWLLLVLHHTRFLVISLVLYSTLFCTNTKSMPFLNYFFPLTIIGFQSHMLVWMWQNVKMTNFTRQGIFLYIISFLHSIASSFYNYVYVKANNYY